MNGFTRRYLQTPGVIVLKKSGNILHHCFVMSIRMMGIKQKIIIKNMAMRVTITQEGHLFIFSLKTVLMGCFAFASSVGD